MSLSAYLTTVGLEAMLLRSCKPVSAVNQTLEEHLVPGQNVSTLAHPHCNHNLGDGSSVVCPSAAQQNQYRSLHQHQQSTRYRSRTRYVLVRQHDRKRIPTRAF